MIIDIIVGIIFVIFAYLGFQRGFISSLIGFIGNIAAIAAAWILSPAVCAWLNGRFDWETILGEKVTAILPLPEQLTQTDADFSSLGVVYSWLENTALPKVVRNNLLQDMNTHIQQLSDNLYANLADIFGQIVAEYILRGIVFLVLWLILAIVIRFVSKLLVSIVHHTPIIGTVDRLGGIAVNLLLVAVAMAVLYGAMEMIFTLEMLQNQQSVFDLFAQSHLLPFLRDLILPSSY